MIYLDKIDNNFLFYESGFYTLQPDKIERYTKRYSSKE